MICRDSHLPLSVGTLTVIFYLLRFAAIFVTGSAVGLLSILSERVNSAMVFVCGVIVVPACIVAMGVESLFDYTALPLLWISGGMFYGKLAPVLIYLALFVGAAVVNRIICCAPRALKAK